MDGYYSLWDIDSRNIINTYTYLQDALHDARGLVRANGVGYADDLELSWTSEDDSAHEVIARGAVLIALTRGLRPRTVLMRRPSSALLHRRRNARVIVRETMVS